MADTPTRFTPNPTGTGASAVQGGTEIFFNNSDRAHWHPYWANDVQSWARSNWNATWTSQIGIRTGAQASQGRGISYFIQMMTGPRYEGQFFDQHETVWGAGLKFQLSQALLFPAAPPEETSPVPAPTPESN